MSTPFLIEWYECNMPEISGSTMIYAKNYADARFGFYLGLGNHTKIVKSISLDVRQAELDIALLVTYRAKQTWGDNCDGAVREVRNTLSSCHIRLDDVRDELAKYGFFI